MMGGSIIKNCYRPAKKKKDMEGAVLGPTGKIHKVQREENEWCLGTFNSSQGQGRGPKSKASPIKTNRGIVLVRTQKRVATHADKRADMASQKRPKGGGGSFRHWGT